LGVGKITQFPATIAEFESIQDLDSLIEFWQ
jgi:hypothetical protein